MILSKLVRSSFQHEKTRKLPELQIHQATENSKQFVKQQDTAAVKSNLFLSSAFAERLFERQGTRQKHFTR